MSRAMKERVIRNFREDQEEMNRNMLSKLSIFLILSFCSTLQK